MKYLVSVISFFRMMIFSSCSHAEQPNLNKNDSLHNRKILIVYLSRTNNTKVVAELIHKNVGGDLVALELQNPYPENYQKIVAQVQQENENNTLPTLKTEIDSIEKYDVIFLGFPTWGMQLPPPMKSFLSQYDFGGKTIVPFNTNAGYGLGSTIQTIKTLAPKSNILKEYSTKGGIERDGILFVMKGDKVIEVKSEVNKWLKSIGF
ncbi:flavodoxin [Rhizosphaericola mali]|uniref:Flavodoxin n=1 Tax=Rhizosphaericola mali TaxID=2545455 RepID=A0A5P2G3L5_9BACT|nr:flavodoxin [Rhizosphaericola mali]QES88412.1 flavodoxin [Rhizosphaericola mali]